MATQYEELSQKAVDLTRQINEFEAKFDDDNLPSKEDESTLEAMYNARADVRDSVSRADKMRGNKRDSADNDGAPPPVVASADWRNQQRRQVSLGEKFTNSAEYQNLINIGIPSNKQARIPSMAGVKVGGLRELGLYADLVTGASSTSGGAFVVNDRTDLYNVLGRRELTIRDLITVRRTTSDTVEFVRQTSRTNNAAAVAEATAASGASGAKPESAMALEVVQAAVQVIANWMPVTRQAVADVAQMRDIIESELRDNLAETLDSEIVAGNGTPGFTGIIETSGTQTQAWDTNILTTTRKARTKVRTVGRATPTAYVLHPTDWETIDLLQDNEARYYFGGPAVVGTPRLWGLPVVENEAVGVGVGVVGDFRKAVLFDREDTQILVSDSHSDFFIRNLLAILAELRAAFGVLQPSAFVEMDLTA